MGESKLKKCLRIFMMTVLSIGLWSGINLAYAQTNLVPPSSTLTGEESLDSYKIYSMDINSLVEEIKNNENQFLMKYMENNTNLEQDNQSSKPRKKPNILNRKIEKGADVRRVVEQYLQDPNIEYIVPDYKRGNNQLPNDPFINQQWAVNTLQLNDVWQLEIDHEVIVAVIDTGVDNTHEDLQGRVIQGYNFIHGNTNTMDDSLSSHGTMGAGIIAAITNNGIGITGATHNVKIMPIKVLDKNGSGYDSGIIEGIIYAADHGADVINLSLGGSQFSQALWDVVKYAYSKGVVVVAAAGNEASTVGYPAAFPEVIAVGATDHLDRKASFSNYGRPLDLVAPGVQILSTTSMDTYSYADGTSFAAPYTAALAGMLKGKSPSLTPAQIEWLMESTALDLGNSGWDHYFGYGRIQPGLALGQTIPIQGPGESNDSLLGALWLDYETQYSFYYQLPHDRDWYKVEASMGDQLTIRFQCDDHDLISQLYVKDSMGNQVGYKKSSLGQIELVLDVNKTDTYYVRLSELNGHWSNQPYFITIERSAAEESIYGDFNKDSLVNIYDLVFLSKRYLMIESDPGWDPAYNSNQDGLINVLDFQNVLQEIRKNR
jgi:hypothetical protein